MMGTLGPLEQLYNACMSCQQHSNSLADHLNSFGCPGAWIQQGENAFACQCPNGSVADLSNGKANCAPRSSAKTNQRRSIGQPLFESQQQKDSFIRQVMRYFDSRLINPPDLTGNTPMKIAGFTVPQTAPLSVYLKAANPRADIPCSNACQQSWQKVVSEQAPPRPDVALRPGTNPFSGKTPADYAREQAAVQHQFDQNQQRLQQQ